MFHHPRTVQPAEHITIATHSAIPMETVDRTETTIEKVCACVCIVSIHYWVIKELGLCVCVRVGVPVVAEVKDSQFGHLSDLIRKKLQFVGPQWHDGHVLAVTDLKHTDSQITLDIHRIVSKIHSITINLYYTGHLQTDEC